MKRLVSLIFVVVLLSLPAQASSVKDIVSRLEEEIEEIKQNLKDLVDEMTIRFSKIQGKLQQNSEDVVLTRRDLAELNRHFQSLSEWTAQQDRRVTALEPRVAAIEEAVSDIPVSDIGDPLPKGSPAPRIGDAVHLDTTTGLIYRADHILRNNVIGVLGSDGKVIGVGGKIENFPFSILPYTAPGYTLYLDYQTEFDVTINATGTPTDRYIAYDASNFAVSQSFVPLYSGVVNYAEFTNGTLTGTVAYDLYAQIRTDDGTGKPSSTVLATSNIMYGNLGTSPLQGWFYFKTCPLLTAGTTYHVCVFPATATVSSTDYIAFPSYDTTGYASGQACVSDNTGTWTAVTGQDIPVIVSYFDTENFYAAKPSNITPFHPFNLDYFNQSVYRIGTVIDSSSFWVSPSVKPSQVLVRDMTTTWSGTGATYQFASPTVTVPTGGLDYILVIFSKRTGGVSTGYMRFYYDGTLNFQDETVGYAYFYQSDHIFIEPTTSLGHISFQLHGTDGAEVKGLLIIGE